MDCPDCGATLPENSQDCLTCPPHQKGALVRFVSILENMESLLLSAFLASMILLVFTQIILRNVFHSGIGGADSFVRHLLLWVVFLGASVAEKEGNHIRVVVIYNLFSRKWKTIVKTCINLFSAVVCALLIYASLEFVILEYEGGNHIAFLNIPVWITELIIPLGYLIIMIRYLVKSLIHILYLPRKV